MMTTTEHKAPATLHLERRQSADRVVTIRVHVRGKVDDSGRAVLDRLHLIPMADMANWRYCDVSTPAELDAIRDALVAAGVVTRGAR